MGNDGGSIPKRRELVKSAARAPTHSQLKATTHESQAHAWSHDPLTTAPLDLDGVVSDWRGNLYNYESILRNLLPSDTDSSASPSNDPSPPSQHASADAQGQPTFASTGIKSLRDIVKLKLARPSDKEQQKRGVRVCPVSLKELGPATKSVYIVPCGHVFAEVAIKQIRQQDGQGDEACPECSGPFETDNVVPVLPTDEAEVKRLARRVEDLKAAGLTHGLKKDKAANGDKKNKKKRKAEDKEGGKGKDKNEDRNENENENGDHDGASDHKRRATEGGVKTKDAGASSRTSGINNPMAASLTAQVMAEQEELSKRRKMAARA